MGDESPEIIETRADTHHRTVWLLVLFTGVIWGAGGLVSKGLVNDNVDAFAITGIPLAAAAIVAWIYTLRKGVINKASMIAGIRLGLLNVAFPPLLFNLAYETMPAGVVTLIISLGPVITASVAHFAFDDERFSRAKAAGLAASVSGVAVLSVSPGVIEGSSYRGLVFVLVGVLIGSSSAVLVRKEAVRYGTLPILAPQLTVASSVSLLIGPLLGRPLIPNGGFETWHLVALLGIGLFASFGGFLSSVKANQLGTTGQVSLIAYLIPVVGVSGGRLFFDEKLTSGVAIGGILILLGMTVAGRASMKPTRTIRSSG